MDSSFPPTGEMLLAEMGDELWAAVELDSGAAIADLFRPSGEPADLLRFRAARMRGGSEAERHGRFALLARAA